MALCFPHAWTGTAVFAVEMAMIDLLWLGAYFGFTALCTMVMAVRLHSQRRVLPVSG
jgi:hypothetical protein